LQHDSNFEELAKRFPEPPLPDCGFCDQLVQEKLYFVTLLLFYTVFNDKILCHGVNIVDFISRSNFGFT